SFFLVYLYDLETIRNLPSFPTRRSSDLANIILDLNHRDKLLQGEVRIVDERTVEVLRRSEAWARDQYVYARIEFDRPVKVSAVRSEEHTSELQSRENLVCRLLLEKKKLH